MCVICSFLPHTDAVCCKHTHTATHGWLSYPCKQPITSCTACGLIKVYSLLTNQSSTFTTLTKQCVFMMLGFHGKIRNSPHAYLWKRGIAIGTNKLIFQLTVIYCQHGIRVTIKFTTGHTWPPSKDFP